MKTNTPQVFKPYHAQEGWLVEVVFPYGIIKSHWEATREKAREFYKRAIDRYEIEVC